MADLSNPLIAVLTPITSRVRTDVTAVRLPDGSSRWTREPLTPERMARHLNGGPARGVCPIGAGESVTLLGVLDFDSHRGEISWPVMSAVVGRVVDVLELAHAAPPVLFRSSGGHGVHLYTLWDDPQDAHSVRQWLTAVLDGAGLTPGTAGVAAGQVEVFPKQDSVSPTGFGNQFILPLAGASTALARCELSDLLLDTDPLSLIWSVCDPVPIVARPVPTSARAQPSVCGEGEVPPWRLALDALGNGRDGTPSLNYDQWRNVVFAIHHETGGSPEGLALAQEWSARSPKASAEFLAERVWPYARSDGRGAPGTPGGAITGGAIMALAVQSTGWAQPLDDSAFTPVLPLAGAGGSGVTGVSGPGAADGGSPSDRRGVPKAHHLCTDQANANRLMRAFGSQVLVANGRWHVWAGTHWAANEADVYRFGCRLSSLIKAEAATLLARATARTAGDGSTEHVGKAEKIAEALVAWGAKSEMRGTIEAAVGLARKMMEVDPEVLDADPWLLNVANGTVDLRTGVLREHRPGDFITRVIPHEYLPDADSSLWERTLLQITREDGAEVPAHLGVAPFLQRWFGYCATGNTQEQVFLVHWGDGGNGKSIVLDTVARVLGPYAGTAAPGLVAGGSGDRHPTEVADLCGKRMVTASETQEGVALTEDLIKRATGDARIKARRMREDFFEFTPTHKLQLLTNAKPTVKGQDNGIWRRVHLVPYTARFGTPEDVAAGRATHMRDVSLLDTLTRPAVLAGVLAWVVRGAVEWFQGGGLRAPPAVLAASEAYRVSQDRVRSFVTECCELGAEFTEPLTLGMGGLYPAYSAWCRDGGTHPLARQRFTSELERVVPAYGKRDAYAQAGGAARRKVTLIVGLRLLPE